MEVANAILKCGVEHNFFGRRRVEENIIFQKSFEFWFMAPTHCFSSSVLALLFCKDIYPPYHNKSKNLYGEQGHGSHSFKFWAIISSSLKPKWNKDKKGAWAEFFLDSCMEQLKQLVEESGVSPFSPFSQVTTLFSLFGGPRYSWFVVLTTWVASGYHTCGTLGMAGWRLDNRCRFEIRRGRVRRGCLPCPRSEPPCGPPVTRQWKNLCLLPPFGIFVQNE